MHKVLGLDLAATGVKAVAIEASFRAHELRATTFVPLAPLAPPPAPAPAAAAIDPSADATSPGLAPPGNDDGTPSPDAGAPTEAPKPVPPPAPLTWADRIRPALATLAADGWFDADQVVCCLPGAQVATHLVSLPFGDPKRIEQTLRFEVEGLIPFDLDDVVFDWHVVSRSATRTELLVAVARREDVASLIALLAEAGCDPETITFSALTLVNLYNEGYLGRPAEEKRGRKAKEPAADMVVEAPTAKVEAILDIGADRSNLLIVSNGDVRFARTLSAAGNDVTRALTKALGVPSEMAEEAKKGLDLGGENEPTVEIAIERAVSGLVREVRATLASHATQTKQPVERLLVCGGGSRLGGLVPFLNESLGLEVARLELPAAKVAPLGETLPESALALAMALRGVGGTVAPRLNFRKGEFASKRESGALKGRIGALAAMAAVLLILLGVSTWAKLNGLEKREEAMDKLLCDTTQKILGKCETDFRVALGKLKGGGSPASAVPNVSAVELVQAVTELFPPGDEVILDDLDISDSNVRLRGAADSFDAVETVAAGLQRNPCFGEVKKSPLTKGKDGKVQFDMDATWSCGKPAEKKRS